ncbi:MAG: hypothetical protein NXY57DRAFT_1064371, partial [Lentinula lateritia]
DYIYTWLYKHRPTFFLISSTASPDDFCHTYALPSTADVPLPPGFLGRQKHVALVSGLISLAQPLEGYYPVPLSKQASRTELVHLLTSYTVHIGSTDVQGDSNCCPEHCGIPQ